MSMECDGCECEVNSSQLSGVIEKTSWFGASCPTQDAIQPVRKQFKMMPRNLCVRLPALHGHEMKFRGCKKRKVAVLALASHSPNLNQTEMP